MVAPYLTVRSISKTNKSCFLLYDKPSVRKEGRKVAQRRSHAPAYPCLVEGIYNDMRHILSADAGLFLCLFLGGSVTAPFPSHVCRVTCDRNVGLGGQLLYDIAELG